MTSRELSTALAHQCVDLRKLQRVSDQSIYRSYFTPLVQVLSTPYLLASKTETCSLVQKESKGFIAHWSCLLQTCVFNKRLLSLNEINWLEVEGDTASLNWICLGRVIVGD